MSDECLMHSMAEVTATLRALSFERSCVDMGWQWEVRRIDAKEHTPPHYGWLIRCSFRRPDRETGAIGTGFGRWWMIEAEATESAVVKTAFAAAKMIVEHELHEAFKFRGRRVFDPHRTLGELLGDEPFRSDR